MEHNEIRRLVKKYRAGETDLAEEEVLKKFFSTNADIPYDLVPDKYLFMAYQTASAHPSLNEDLISKIKFRPDNKIIPIWKRALKYAAVILPLTIIGYVLVQKNKDPQSGLVIQETIKDKDEAMKEVSTALQTLAIAMHDGLEDIKQLEMLKDIGDELNQSQMQKKEK